MSKVKNLLENYSCINNWLIIIWTNSKISNNKFVDFSYSINYLTFDNNSIPVCFIFIYIWNNRLNFDQIYKFL